eukprot:831741-Pleurochrysis_carterae.AAC.2
MRIVLRFCSAHRGTALQVRQRMLEQQRLAAAEASLGEGLNRMGKAEKPAGRAVQGPYRGGGEHGGGGGGGGGGGVSRAADWRVSGPADSESDGFEWTPPEGQVRGAAMGSAPAGEGVGRALGGRA